MLPATRKCYREDAYRTAAICNRSGLPFCRADNCRPDDRQVWHWLAPDVMAVVAAARRLPASRRWASGAAAGVAAVKVALLPRRPVLPDAVAVVAVTALSSPAPGRLDAAAGMRASGEMPLGPLPVPPGCGGGGGLMAAFDGAEAGGRLRMLAIGSALDGGGGIVGRRRERSRSVLIIADHQREAHLLGEAAVLAEQQSG
jgi:hypothetical protein